MRIGFALCFLVDRILMLFFLDFYFSPTKGVMPYRVTGHNWELVGWHQYSLFLLFPESEAFLWMFSGLGILQGVILLMGATRHLRWHMFGIYLNIMSFRNHNTLYWDGEDDMFRIWAFLLLFFPLDHCTIYDGFGTKTKPTSQSSWPMWIFRLFQIEIMVIYMGASLAKAVVPDWQNGSAIFSITYGIQDFPGIFNPELLFGRYGPLKILTWNSLLVEGTCYLTVWIPSLRKLSIGLMILFHVGIDLSMNMHMFEWLSCVGWLVFFVQPETDNDGEKAETKSLTKKNKKNKKANVGSFLKTAVINGFVASFIVSISMDCIPFDAIGILLPESITPSWGKVHFARNRIFHNYIDPILTPLGLAQGGDWGMYTDVEQVVVNLRLDTQLTNGTIVKNIWRSPDWFQMTNWERKFHCREANFYDALVDNKNELLYFVEVMSKSFVEENDVKALEVIKENRAHYKLKMKSSGGFWSPVLKPPMNAYFEETALKLGVGDCVNALPSCPQLIKKRDCRSVAEQCRKSCSKHCSDFSSFAIDFWLDPNSYHLDDDHDDVHDEDDDYTYSTGEL